MIKDELKLKADGTIVLIDFIDQERELIRKEIDLASDKSTVILELLPLEITLGEEFIVSSLFEMMIKYPALEELGYRSKHIIEFYLSGRYGKESCPYSFILFQKIVSKSITKINNGNVEKFFITEPMMFGVHEKTQECSRLTPKHLLYCLETPIHIHKHVSFPHVPAYEDGLNLLELITAAFSLNKSSLLTTGSF